MRINWGVDRPLPVAPVASLAQVGSLQVPLMLFRHDAHMEVWRLGSQSGACCTVVPAECPFIGFNADDAVVSQSLEPLPN